MRYLKNVYDTASCFNVKIHFFILKKPEWKGKLRGSLERYMTKDLRTMTQEKYKLRVIVPGLRLFDQPSQADSSLCHSGR